MTVALREIPLAQLKVHPANSRQDAGDISDLVASIKDMGVLSPLVVVANGAGWYVVDGSRRLAAARKAGRDTVPAVVQELSDAEAAAAAIVANIQRLDLGPLEEAKAYREWLTLTGKTQKELGEKVGRAPSTIANALRLLDAPKPLKEALERGDITAAHARVALSLPDPSLVSKLKLKPHVTVDELEEKVEEIRRDWQRTGAPAIVAAQGALARAKVAHPDATITWQPEDRVRWKVSLVKALGKPPKAIVGRIYGDPKRHDKLCACRAYEFEARDTYGNRDETPTFETHRVCVDRAGYKKVEGYAPGATRAPKGPTKADREREIAKEAKERVADPWAHTFGRRRDASKSDALARKLAKHRDAERLVLFALVDYLGAPAYTFHAWQAIAALKIDRVRELIRLHAVQKSRILSEPQRAHRERPDRGRQALLDAFGIAATDLGWLAADAPKAKR